MNRKIRVAVVIPRYFPIFGGAENQCRALCKELQLAGSATVAFVLTKLVDPSSPRRENVDGIAVHRLGPRGLGRWSQYAFFVSMLVRLILTRSEYDVIHSHASGLPGAFSTLAGLLAKRPVILKISTNGELLRAHRRPSRNSVGTALWRLIAWMNARYANIVALNGEGLAEAAAAGARSARIIENGVDLSIFRPPRSNERDELRLRYGIPLDSNVLLFTGRFVRRKGIDLLATAFEAVLLDPAANRLLLLLVGSDDLQIGSAVDAIGKLAQHGRERVRIIPPVTSPDEHLRLADAFVFPSRREGMPNAVLEALATGLPCIVSDIAPHRELAVANPFARFLFFKSGDAEDLARALRDYAVNPKRDTRQSSLNNKYVIESVAARYAELYHLLTLPDVRTDRPTR